MYSENIRRNDPDHCWIYDEKGVHLESQLDSAKQWLIPSNIEKFIEDKAEIISGNDVRTSFVSFVQFFQMPKIVNWRDVEYRRNATVSCTWKHDMVHTEFNLIDAKLKIAQDFWQRIHSIFELNRNGERYFCPFSQLKFSMKSELLHVLHEEMRNALSLVV